MSGSISITCERGRLTGPSGRSTGTTLLKTLERRPPRDGTLWGAVGRAGRFAAGRFAGPVQVAGGAGCSAWPSAA